MTKDFTLVAESRTVTGKKVKTLRKAGQVPAVVYGQAEPKHIKLDSLKTRLILRDADDNALFKLQIDGDTHTVIARDVQRHVLRGDLIHIDFYEVNDDTPIKTVASIFVTGRSVPESQGLGTTTQVLNQIEIEAKPADLVSEIEVKAEKLEKPSQVLLVKDIDPPVGVTILTRMEVPVAKFTAKRKTQEQELEQELQQAEESII